MVDLIYCLTNLLFFDIPLLYYTYLNSSIILYLFSGDIYFSLGVSISFLAWSFCEYNPFENFCVTLVILLAILLPTKSPVASGIFWIAYFEAVFIASVLYF